MTRPAPASGFPPCSSCAREGFTAACPEPVAAGCFEVGVVNA